MKIFIYNESLKIETDIKEREHLQEQIKCLDDQIKIRVAMFTGILRGILFEKQNNNFYQEQLENIKLSGISLENKKSINNTKICNSIVEGEEKLPNFRKRKNGVWEGRQQKNGISYSAYSKDLKICKKKLKDKINNRNNENIQKMISVKEWFTKWAENYKYKNVKYKTYCHIKNIINHISNNFKNTYLKDLTTELIQETISKLKPSRTRNLICLYLNAGLEKAYQLDYISKNPYKATEIKRAKENKGNAFTYEEQVKIVEEIKGLVIEPLFYVYVLTGIRRNEIYNIIEINEDKEYIKVIKEKSDDKIKTIYVKSEVIKIIKSIDFKKVKTDYFYKKFKKLLKELNIEGNVHSLRHTYATNNYYLGTPVKHLQEFMGHEDIALTYNIYTDIDPELTREKILKLYNNLYYTF